MKKILALVLALLLMSGVALSEELNLQAMTDEQLMEYYTQIVTELMNRGILNEHLYVGEYIVGEDLEPGRYVLSVVEAYENKYENAYIEYQVLEYNASSGKWDRLTFVDLYHVGEKTSVTLKEGQKLKISNGEFEIMDYRKLK